ncbi:hypothetical protein D3C85_1217840 [compost metagenome]
MSYLDIEILEVERLARFSRGVLSDDRTVRSRTGARRVPAAAGGHLRPGAEPAAGDGGGWAAAGPHRRRDGDGFHRRQPVDHPAGADDRPRRPVHPAPAASAGRAARHPAGRAADRRRLSGAGGAEQHGGSDRQRGGRRRRRRPDSGPGAGRDQARLSDAVRHGDGPLHHGYHERGGHRGGDGGGPGRGGRLGLDPGAVERAGLCGGGRLAAGRTRSCGEGARPKRRD